LFDNFPIQNGIRQKDALSPLLYNFVLENAIRKVEETWVGLKLNGTCDLLVSADDMNILEDNIYTIQKNTETLIDASKEVGVNVNIVETKYMLATCHENAGQNWDTKIANRSFQNVS
jgi:hypothetical protein